MFRSAIVTSIGVVALACQFFLPVAVSAGEVEDKLTERIQLGIAVQTPFKEALGYLSRFHGLKIEIDEEAFARENRKNPKDMRTSIAKMDGVFVNTFLRYVLLQADAIYIIRDKSIVIVPNTEKGKPLSFPPYSEKELKAQEQLRDAVAKKGELKIEKDVEGPILDTSDLLNNQLHLRLIIDPAEFKGAGGEKAVIKAGKYAFKDLMAELLKGIKATFQIEPDHIRIVRQRES